MSLPKAFASVRPSVVAFMPSVIKRFPKESGDIFPIIGTGVIVDDGLIATNAHVVDALCRLERPRNFPKDKFPFVATLFHAVKPGDNAAIVEDTVAEVPLQVIGVFRVEGLIPRGKGCITALRNQILTSCV
jgi:S1-C subfamily serine protease